MRPDYSVIICAHNPRPDYLGQTLAALRAQTLPYERWELLLIDNLSTQRLADAWDLSWHSRARHIRENELGLTPARLRGIREANGEMLVFVDDDNLLATDFLEQIAVITAKHPYLGAIGPGLLEPDYEIQPPPELTRLAADHGGLLPLLALRRISSPQWSNNPRDWSSMPWGAGLCVSRETAAVYVGLTQQLKINAVLDRRGNELFCSGDDLFSWASVLIGKGFGVFPDLRVVHLIRAGRLEPDHLLGLIHGWWISDGVLRYMLAGDKPRAIGIERAVRILLGGLKNGLFHMRVKMAAARGELRARRFISKNHLRPLDSSALKVACHGREHLAIFNPTVVNGTAESRP